MAGRGTPPAGRHCRRLRGHIHHPADRGGARPAVHRQRDHLRDLLPRPAVAGATADDPRDPVRRRAADRARPSPSTADDSASTTRSTCSTGSLAKGIVVGADYDIGARRSSTARPPASATPSSPSSRSGPSCSTGCPGHPVARARRRRHLAGRRCRRRRALRARAGSLFDRVAMASPWPASRCRSSSPACSPWRSSATSWGITAPGGSYMPFTENPAAWAYDLILPWITLAFLFAALYARLTRAGHAGDDERGLHPHRAGQGPAASAASSSSTGCAPR